MLSALADPWTVRTPPDRPIAAKSWRDSSCSMRLADWGERAGRRGAFITSPEKWAVRALFLAKPLGSTSLRTGRTIRPNPLTLEFVRILKRPQQFPERAFL